MVKQVWTDLELLQEVYLGVQLAALYTEIDVLLVWVSYEMRQ